MLVRYLRPAVGLILLMTALLGFAYPLVTTGISRVAFPSQAEGSLLRKGDALIGSALIGQNFSDPRYFWGRPSATAPQPYNGLASGGTNFGPLNPALLAKVNANAKALRDADPDNKRPIPVDLVTSSASGLDPDISVAAAQYQAGRVARARNLSPDAVRSLIAAHTSRSLLGFIGENRVHVLQLNLALDQQ
jgi:potassium-transporting ATPase KdpC subunit